MVPNPWQMSGLRCLRDGSVCAYRQLSALRAHTWLASRMDGFLYVVSLMCRQTTFESNSRSSEDKSVCDLPEWLDSGHSSAGTTHRQLFGQVLQEPGMPLDLGDADAVVGLLGEQAANQVAALRRDAPRHRVLAVQDRLHGGGTHGHRVMLTGNGCCHSYSAGFKAWSTGGRVHRSDDGIVISNLAEDNLQLTWLQVKRQCPE